MLTSSVAVAVADNGGAVNTRADADAAATAATANPRLTRTVHNVALRRSDVTDHFAPSACS